MTTALIISDPYVAAGLRRNPFVAEQSPGVAEEVFIDLGLPTAADGEVLAAGRVIELVGCRGSGKTTHLLRWCRDLSGTYHHVDRGWQRVRPLPGVAASGGRWAGPAGAVVAWDEVDRVPRPLLRGATAHARRHGMVCLLGTHQPTGVADVTVHMPGTTQEAVLRFFAARVATVVLPGAAGPTLSVSEAAEVAADACGSWRSVGSALHVLVARRVQVDSGASGVQGEGHHSRVQAEGHHSRVQAEKHTSLVQAEGRS